MATVTGFTAARMQEIEDTTIVDGNVVGDNLILEARDGSTIDAGSVRGPQGTAGTNGTNGTNGATGPAGPTAMLGTPVELNTQPAAMSSSGVISGMVKNNVSVVSGHRLGIKVDFTLEWASVDPDSRWDIWFRLNGVNVERFRVIRPVITATSFQEVVGEVFWIPPTTQATDDIEVYAQEVVPGAIITPSGSSTLKRKLWIVDYGV